MMEAINKVILSVHVFAGFTSLVSFMIPMFVKKGAKIHRKVGKIYVNMMWVVVVTAFLLSVINFIEGETVKAVFLGYLSILTASPLWSGLAILKYKKDIPDAYLKKRKLFEVLVVILAIANLVYFFYLGGKGQAILLLIFGGLGLTSLPAALASINKLRDGSNWYIDHLGGMIGAGIAAYTAFFAFGGYTFFGNLFFGRWVAIPWILPSIVGAITISYFKRKYLRGVSKKSLS